MTCYLFWVAAPATPQLKIPPHPQPRATCFFDGRNSQPQPQLYQILASIFILSSIKSVKNEFFESKFALNCYKAKFLSYGIAIYIKRKGIPIFTFYIFAEKRANLGSHIASLKMYRTHAHRKFQKNGFAPAHRNLRPHIATRNLRSHIASHALDFSLTLPNVQLILHFMVYFELNKNFYLLKNLKM